MCERLNNLTELNYLWKHRGNKNYNLISMVSCGNFARYMMFDDRQNNRKVIGKIITFPREGEAYHWPRLLHENLVPLLEIVAMNEATSVYIFPSVGSCLKNVIHDKDFRNDPDCFDRKKAYAGDILWALDYLHQRSLCILNLTETIIYISDVADKAMICDFSCVVLTQRAAKENMKLPNLYQAPEVNTGYFQPVRFEAWVCGVMLLQVFSQHRLPSAFIGNEIHPVLQAVMEINYDIIKEANPGSSLHQSDIESLKSFLGLFLKENPDQRTDVQLAAISSFLRVFKRKFVGENISRTKHCEDSNANMFCSFKTTSVEEHDYPIKSTTFKDIYLTEAAKYKNKLRQLPSNKFINLENVPNCREEKKLAEKQYDMKESSWDITCIKAHETSADSVLPIKNNSKESVISDNKETIPQLFQNEFHDIYSKSVEVNKKLKLLQNNSGNATDSTFQNWHIDACQCYLVAERLYENVINRNCSQFVSGAKHKDKLMRLPSTNKFINLKYIPNIIEEKISTEKLEEKESSKDVTYVTEHETSTDSVPSIQNKTKESLIGNKKETIPDVFQNEFHYLFSKSIEVNDNISLELLQNTSTDVVDNTFETRPIDTDECYLDAKRLYEEVTDSNSKQFTTRNNFVSNKNKHESNSNSPNESDVSTDSLETLENTEIKSRKLDLNPHKNKINRTLHKKRNELCLYSPYYTEFPKNKAEANLYRVKSESNMKNICIKNISLTNFRSDSCLVDSSTEKCNEAYDLTSAITPSSNSNINNLGQLLGSSNLCRESDSETNGRNRECHENSYVKKDTHNQMFHRNTQNPTIDNLLLQNKSPYTDDFLHQNDVNNSLKQQYLHKNAQRDDAFNQQEVDNVMFLMRRNSYKQAVSNGLKETTKPNSNKLLKSMFRKRKQISINSEQKSGCSLSSIKKIPDFLISKSDSSNMNLFVCSGLESMETSSLLSTSGRKRNTKKAKKTWIQCLCLGGKA